jgi:hypothetical protein
MSFKLPTMEKGKTRSAYEAELEQFAKDQFSRVENLINRCRETGRDGEEVTISFEAALQQAIRSIDTSADEEDEA